MRLRRYCVTVMDNWTPTRFFWTRNRAMRWHAKFIAGAHLYEWQGSWGGFWSELEATSSLTSNNSGGE